MERPKSRTLFEFVQGLRLLAVGWQGSAAGVRDHRDRYSEAVADAYERCATELLETIDTSAITTGVSFLPETLFTRNQLAARIIAVWRACGDLDGLAMWVRPIEEALAAAPAAGSRQLRAALADASEDTAEALYLANPCEATARALLRSRAADRLASLDHDREIAERYGLML